MPPPSLTSPIPTPRSGPRVDSSVVAALAFQAVGDRALAVTAAAKTLAGRELDHTRRVAAEIGSGTCCSTRSSRCSREYFPAPALVGTDALQAADAGSARVEVGAHEVARLAGLWASLAPRRAALGFATVSYDPHG